MKSSVFEGIKVVMVLMIGLVLCNPVTARAKEPELNKIIAEDTLNATVDENALNVNVDKDAGTAYIDDYMNDEALTSSSRAAAAEYFGIDSKDVQLLADFGISVTDYTNMPATFTIDGIFGPSYVSDEQDKLTLFNIDDAGILSVIPYEYLDGAITFTTNTAGHFFLVQNKSVPLTYTELETTVSGYTIKVTGNMPEEAELSVIRVYNTDQLEEVIGDEDYSIYVAFDIKILVDGEVWQPVDDGETVTITATNIEIPEGEELKVYRIEDEALESINVPKEAVVELSAVETTDGDIEVETEHFTTYTIGGVSYNSIKTGTWLGMTYETYDTDRDGTAETLVMSGTQTATATTDSKSETYYKKAPYYQNNIVNIIFKEGSILTNGAFLFDSCTNLTSINITNADTSNVTNMRAMFSDCSSLTGLDLSRFNTANVTDMFLMFSGCSSLISLDLSKFNTANVKSMANMFEDCSALTSLDISGFNTTQVTNIRWMFYGCSSLTSLDVSKFNTASVTDMASMFKDCSQLTTLDVSKFNTAKVTSMYAMFSDCSQLTTLDVSKFNTVQVSNMGYMFHNCSSLTSLDASGFNTARVTDMSYMFYCCSSLTRLDVSGLSTANVQDMENMFYNCSSLTNLDVSGFNTANVKEMNSMFSGCSSLTSLDVSKFNTAKVTKMYYMFKGCSSLTNLNVSGFDTANVTDMYSMFYNCSSLTSLNVSNFSTSQIKNMSCMFDGCSKLTSLNVSGLDTANATNMSSMFAGCSSLTSLNISNFNTSKVTRMYCMFSGCSSLTSLDLSKLNTVNVTDMRFMFENCSNLTNLDVGGFNTSKVTSSSYMFTLSNCNNLQKFSAPKTNSHNIVLPSKADCAWYLDDVEPKLEADTKTTYTTILNPVTDQSHTYIRSDIEGFSIPFKTATLLASNNFRSQIYTLAGNYTNVYKITWVDQPFTSDTVLSTSDSDTPVYARTTTDGVPDGLVAIELYSDADVIYANPNSTRIFDGMTKCKSIDMSKVNMSKVTTLERTFNNCQALETIIGINNWDISSCTTLRNTFNNCSALQELDLSNWDTSNVTDLYYTFADCTNLHTLNISTWDVAKVRDMYDTFYGCSALTTLNLSSWNPVASTSMYSTFSNCTSLSDINGISDWDLTNCTSISSPFNGCAFTELDLSGWILGSSTYVSGIFEGCPNLQKIKAPKTIPADKNIYPPYASGKSWYRDDDEDLEADDTTIYGRLDDGTWVLFINNVVNTSHTYIRNDIEGFSLPRITSTLISGDAFRSSMYALSGNDMRKITSIVYDEDPDDTVKNVAYNTISTPDSKVEIRMCFIDGIIHCYPTAEVDKIYANSDCAYMFGADRATYGLLENCTNIDLTWLDTSRTTNMCAMFEYCKKLTNLDVSRFNTSKATDMLYMFYGCSSLASLDVSGFNTSNVTNMGEMFRGCASLTSLDLSGFNTSKVTNMSCMFTGCSSLTGIVFGNTFDTSNVTDMGYMFYKCPKLTSLDVSKFNTEKVTNMFFMFHSCSSLTDLDVSKFNTENVTNMSGMFYKCSKLTSLDVSKFNTSKVTDMSYMFWNCSSLTGLDVSNFDTSNSENFASMFAYCENLTGLNVIYFDTSKGADFSEMFSHCTKLTYLLIHGARTGNVFNTANGTNFDRMFDNCRSLTQLDISLFDCSKGTNFNQILGGCDNLQRLAAPKTLPTTANIELPVITDTHWYLDDVEPFNMADSNTTYTSVLNNLSNQSHVYIRDDLEDFQHFVTTAYLIPGLRWRTALFELAGNSSPEISGFNNTITDLYSETEDGSDIIENTITDIVWTDAAFDSTTDTSAICVSTSSGLPVYARMGTEDGKTVVELYTEADVVYLNSNCGHMFQCFDALETISFFTDKINASQVSNANCMFAMQWKHIIDKNNENHSLTYTISLSSPKLTRLDLRKCTFEQTTKFTDMFYNCRRLISLDVSNFDTSSGTNFDGMFERCDALTSLDISKFDTSNGTNFSSMFYGCSGLTGLDVSKFNTSKGSDFSYMFGNCQKLTSLDVSKFNTSNSTNFGWMFGNCQKLTSLDVSSFDTSKGTDFTHMFYGCNALTSLDVSKFSTSNGINFSSMFSGCSSLTNLDVSNFDTSNGTDFNSMFWGCSALTDLNISSFDTSSGTDFSQMFYSCSSLTSLDVSNFNTSQAKDLSAMFSGCVHLTSLNVRNFVFGENASYDRMFADCPELTTIYGLTGLKSLDDNMFIVSSSSNPLNDPLSGFLLSQVLSPRYNGDFDAFWADNQEGAPITYEEAKTLYEASLGKSVYYAVIQRFNGDFDAFWETVKDDVPLSYDELKSFYDQAVIEAQEVASQPKTILYFADYEDFTSDCWFDYDWAADGRSVCIYNVSIPAVAAGLTLNTEDTTETSGTIDVAIEKFVSAEAIQITTPSVLKLTCTTDPTGYLTYMFSEADTSQTYEQLKDSVFTFSDSNSTHTSEGVTENETGPKYSAKEQYILPIFRGQDQKIRGHQYTGNLVLNFAVAN